MYVAKLLVRVYYLVWLEMRNAKIKDLALVGLRMEKILKDILSTDYAD